MTFNAGSGLTNLRDYGVLVRDANNIHLGALFDSAMMDTLRDEIVFQVDHNLVNNEFVYYHASGNAEIGGLVTGKRYRVFVVDDSTIKLQDVGQALPSDSVSRAAFSGQTISSTLNSHGLADGDAVTYVLPKPKEFSSFLVDVTVNDANDPPITEDFQNKIFLDDHGFNTGNAAVYRAGGTPTIDIARPDSLVNGNTYFVIKVDNDHIQLAEDLCKALGTCIDDKGTLDTDDDDEVIPQEALNLIRESDSISPDVLVVHTLRRLADEPIGGLVEGRVYFVTESTRRHRQRRAHRLLEPVRAAARGRRRQRSVRRARVRAGSRVDEGPER